VRIGVIDIGASTTCSLVTELTPPRPRQTLVRRHSMSPSRVQPEELADLVRAEAALARQAGAQELVVAGRATLRGTHHARLLGRVCRQIGAGELRILGAREKAELAFDGAAAGQPEHIPVAVATIGLSSTEVAVGYADGGTAWRGSRPAGVWRLTDGARFSDPPQMVQLEAAGSAAWRSLSSLQPPPAERALLAGGAASAAIRSLCGSTIDAASLQRAREHVASVPGEILAGELMLTPGQARPVPATLAVLDAVVELLGQPLQMVGGGIREGLAIARQRELRATAQPA
jgi:exopolyphosphatase/pppGpp-phosphohydrolase